MAIRKPTVKSFGVHRHRMEESRKKQLLNILNGPYFGIETATDEVLALYNTALTHSSLANEMKQRGMKCDDYERLEFFGNYLLEFVVAEHLYSTTYLPQGGMSTRLKVTDNYNLADIVMKYDLGLDDAVVLSKGTPLTDSIIADTFEAFIGAIYYNASPKKARGVILRIFGPEIEQISGDKNAKGLLQEYTQSHQLEMPKYTYAMCGPDHAPTWTASISIGDENYGEGSGPKKRQAAMDAAQKALLKLSAG